MKRLLLNLLKVAISVGIIAYLVIDAKNNNVFSKLANQPKKWDLLAAAAVLCFLGVLVTVVRWHFLIRALGLPIRFKESLRLGFLGYLFNLSPVGIVGGDLIKAVMLARPYPGRRAEAAATVFVDRVIGLYVLFVVASAAILVTRFWQSEVHAVQAICQATLWLTGIGTAAMVVMLVPNVTSGTVSGWVSRVPYVGSVARQLIDTVRIYRWNLPVLLLSVVLSVAVHSLFAVGILLVASALYQNVHTLATHFVVSPLSAATGVLPISMGPFEYVLDRLYAVIPLPGGGHMTPGQGLVVALGYRIITLLTAAVGAAYYLASREELAEVIHTVEKGGAGDQAAGQGDENMRGEGTARCVAPCGVSSCLPDHSGSL